MILVRICFVALIAGPIVLGVVNYFRNKSTSDPDKTTHFNALINSAVFYTIAFNLIFFFQELFLVLGKKALGLTAYLYHNNHSWDGSHPLESLMQGSGAAAIFLIGVICLIWLQTIRKSKSIWKLLLIWLAYHGLIQSVPQVMVAFFARDTDVGQALAGYLKLDQSVLAVLAVVSIIVTVFVSVWFARPILELAADDVDTGQPKARLRFMRNIVAGAAILGCCAIAPFRIPPMTQMIGPFVLLLFSIPWTWSIAGFANNIKKLPNDMNEKVRWEPILILVILLLIFRIILAPGVKF